MAHKCVDLPSHASHACPWVLHVVHRRTLAQRGLRQMRVVSGTRVTARHRSHTGVLACQRRVRLRVSVEATLPRDEALLLAAPLPLLGAGDAMVALLAVPLSTHQ